MNRFELNKPIKPLEVNMDFVSRIEKYLRFTVPDQYLTEPYTSDFHIDIHDNFGIETIESIDNWNLSLFQDSTNRLKISSEYRDPNSRIQIQINLSCNDFPSYSEIRITTTGKSSKDNSLNIYRGILSIINTQKSSHRAFHIGTTGSLVRYLIFSTSLFVLAIPNIHSNALYTSIFISIIIICAYHYISSRYFKPYIIFDTQKNRNLSSSWNWLSISTLTFLIFGTALVQLRKNIFGF